MLNLEEISNTINELENSDTTFDTCIKLSALYNVKEHLENRVQTMSDSISIESDDVEHELADILPHYRKYCDTKRNWQLGNASKNLVMQEMQNVCQEIREFIEMLYGHTSMPDERIYIEETCSYLHGKFSKN